MQDEPRTPPPDLRSDLKAARDDASLKAGLAKLALESPGPPQTGARLRNYFLTGLVVVGPVGITLYIAWNFIAMVDGWVKPYVPSIYNPDSYLPFPVPGVGLVFAVLLLTIIGALAANLLGRSLISAGELMLGRTPIVRNVYQGLKQIFESVVSASSVQQSFQKVAVMEFPSKGIWSIVFVTGEAAREITKEVPGERVHADGHAAALRLRVLRAAQERGADPHERGGRCQDHHLRGHGEPGDPGQAARHRGQGPEGQRAAQRPAGAAGADAARGLKVRAQQGRLHWLAAVQ
jgi:uncharacterized membrane protein